MVEHTLKKVSIKEKKVMHQKVRNMISTVKPPRMTILIWNLPLNFEKTTR